MKRILKIILLSAIVLVIIPVIILFTLSRIHHQSVHDEITDYINDEFDGKIIFRDFSFSYIRHFPRAHIRLGEVSLLDGKKEIIKIGELNVSLHTLSLWQKKIKLKDLLIQDASLYLVIDSLGKKPEIALGDSDKSDSVHKAKLIEADNIRIINSTLYFENQVKHNRTGFSIHEAQFDLTAEDSLLVLSGKFDGHLDSLISANTLLFANQPVKALDVVMTVNQQNGFKQLKSGYLLVHNLKLFPKLHMKPYEDGQKIELHILGEDNFDTFLDLFEFHTGIDLVQSKPDAQLILSYNQEGFVNPFLRPYTEIDFEISGAEFSGAGLPFPLEIKSIKGNYNNGEGHSPQTVELVIDTILAEVQESFVNARFKLTNLHDPVIDARFYSSINLDHLFRQDKNIRLSGIIEADLFLDGKISELKDLHLEGKQHAKGSVKVRNLEMILNEQGQTIQLTTGSTLLNNHIFEVTSLVGAFNRSAFHFQGMFENLDQILLKNNEELVGSFTFEFDQLDLRNLGVKRSKESKEGSQGLLPFSNSAIELSVKGNKVITDFGSLENISFTSKLNDQKLSIQNLHADLLDGSVDGYGNIILSDTGITGVQTKLDLSFNRLKIDSLLHTFDHEGNSGHKPLTDQIPFNLDAKLNFRANEIIYQDAWIRGTQTQLQITNKEIEVKDFFGVLPFGEIALTMNVSDYTTKNIRYAGDIELQIDSLKIDRMLKMKAFGLPDIAEDKKSSREKNRKKQGSFPENIDISLNIGANYLAYENASINNVDLKIDYLPGNIDLKNLNFKFAGGNVHVNGYIDWSKIALYPGYLYSSADSIDLGLFLKAFDNFGQNLFTPENTTGRISWASHYYFLMDEGLKPLKDENLVLLNTNIHDASFDKVEPIEKTLFFVGHKSKDHMIVKDLNVNVFLYQDKLYFLDLLMNDNIADLDAFGMMDLDDQTMDLGLEISLSDLLFRMKKNRMVQTQEGTITLEDDAKIFLKLSGPLSDHKINMVSEKKFTRHRMDLMDNIQLAEREFKQKHTDR